MLNNEAQWGTLNMEDKLELMCFDLYSNWL